MGNIFTSSIGRKLIMSITGAFLVLFLTFHMLMNLTLIFSDEAYNMICEFLGANWYALIGTAIIALGVVVHFVYAFILTVQNRRARGSIRYAVTGKEKGVHWSSKNMLVLGFIVLVGLALHLYNFWYEMQLVEIMGEHVNSFGQSPTNGAWIVRNLFSQPVYVAVYIVWIAAIWFHLTHGVWSMLHTVGWNSKVWMNRVKWISYIISTLVMGGFALVIVAIYIQSLM